MLLMFWSLSNRRRAALSLSRMLPWGITIIAAATAFGCNNQAAGLKESISIVEEMTLKIKSNIERYDYSALDNNFGTGSKSYYATKPVIFLKAGGKAVPITVHWDKNDNDLRASASAEDISGKWEKRNGNWNLMVTPPGHAGYYTVHFSNKVNSDAFDVLVVVE